MLPLPHRWQYRLAWDHDLCRRVTTIVLRAVFRLLTDDARAIGLEQPRGGAVAIVQRFGGALNLNVHIHALVLDGVFVRDAAGGVVFRPARRLTSWTWRRCWLPWSHSSSGCSGGWTSRG